MLSIVTVNWNSYDFLHLLIESIEHFTKCTYELIVVDNSINKSEIKQKNVTWIPTQLNIGHGAGLNLGASHAKYPYVAFLDVDCHIINHGWDQHFIKNLETCDLIGAKGVESKPIRPACMCFKAHLAKYDWRDTPNYKGHRITPEGFDVAIQAYHQIKKDGYRIRFTENHINSYKTLNGEVWGLDNKPLVYHHWHGSHLSERSCDFPGKDLDEDKNLLFTQIPWRIP